MRRKTDILEIQARLFKALAHRFRLQLLYELARDEECVCHLAALFDRPQPYVSQQLGELRDANLLLDRREGQRTYYRLADERVVPLLRFVHDMTDPSLDVPTAPRERLTDCQCPKCS